MTTVTANEAQSRFDQLLESVAKGEEIVITQHNKPIARLVPEGRDDREASRKAIAGLRELRKSIALRGEPPLTVEEILSAIREGRR